MHYCCTPACTFIPFYPLHSCTFNCTPITHIPTLYSTCTHSARGCTYPASSAFYMHSICSHVAEMLRSAFYLHSICTVVALLPALLSPFIPYTPALLIALQLHAYLHFTRPAHILHSARGCTYPASSAFCMHSICTHVAFCIFLALNMHCCCTPACTFIPFYPRFYPLHSCTFNCTPITRIPTLYSTCTPRLHLSYILRILLALNMHCCCTSACTFIPYTPALLIALQLHACLHFTPPAHILHDAALILHPLHFTCTQYALMLRSCLHFYPLHSCILVALNMHSRVYLPTLNLHSAYTHSTCTLRTCTQPALYIHALNLHFSLNLHCSCLHFYPLHSCTLHARTQYALKGLSTYTQPALCLHALNLLSAYMHSTCTLHTRTQPALYVHALNLHFSLNLHCSLLLVVRPT